MYNPVNTSVNSVTRAWIDANSNFIPDCNMTDPAANGECREMSNAAFGQLNITTRPDEGILTGWQHRPYNWQASATVQHELKPGVAVGAGYYRTWFGHFTVVDNLSVTPDDYSPYCVTAPVDSRLPQGGGNQLCGFYDISPTKFGQVNNLVKFADKFGTQTQIYNGVDFNASARLPGNALVSGGVNIGDQMNTGQSASNNCFVVDSPQQLRFCDVRPPYQARLKMYGSYPLPWWGIQTSATFQNLPGPPISATYAAPTANIALTLGRPLAGGARTASVQLLEPFSQFEGRITQLDLRLMKVFHVRTRGRIQAMFDVYNALNANPILALNTTYGPQWLVPQQILDGRIFKFGGQFEF